MAKPKAIVKVEQKSQEIVQLEPWEIEAQQAVKEARASETLGIPRITHRAGVLKFNDQPVKDNRLVCAVMTYTLSKEYYPDKFDPAKPATPSCYAFIGYGTDAESKMVPHTACSDKQADACQGCKWNAFNTAEVGRGKACKDSRRLLVTFGVEGKGAQLGEVAVVSVPPASLKGWSAFLGAAQQVNPIHGFFGVLTEITTYPLNNGGHGLAFKVLDKLDKAQVQALHAKGKEMQGELMKPFPVIDQEEAPPQRSEKAKRKVK